jgi:hypothetical protein
MSKDITEYKLPAAIRFEDFGLINPAERLLQGDVMKCIDGQWSSKSGISFPHGTRMIVAATAHAIQKWAFDRPEETIVETPDRPLPDLGELNAATPQEQWEDDLNGNPKPPYVHQFVGYLVDPRDASVYTFINSTAGAEVAITMLESRIARMRALSGRRVAAVVELGERVVSKRYNKLGPMFHIVDWLPLDGGPAPVASAGPRPIEHATRVEGQSNKHKAAHQEEINEIVDDDEPDVRVRR